MKGSLKIIVIVLFAFLVLGLTISLGMPYRQLDWENYAGAYSPSLPYSVYLPLVMRNSP